MDMNAAMSMVLDTLRCATNQNQDILKPAELKLKEWEVEPGFYSILLSIFSNHSVDVNVRWMAVLYFKNGVDRYWRKAAPNAISEDEKAKLRLGLVANIREPVSQLATQLAVLIAKVGRHDCPREWPELVPTLLTAVRDPDALVQHRALLILHHVVKTLSSKRLAGDKRLFQELSGNIFSFALSLWNSHTEMFLRQVSEDTAMATASLEKALLALRILRKLTVNGFKQPHESEDVVTFINMVFDRAKTMLECRKQCLDRNSLRELIEKFVIHLTKVLLSVLETHPFSFIDFIQPCLQFIVYYAFMDDGQPLVFGRFVILCLNLIKLILDCVEYKPAKVISDTKDPNTLRALQIKTSFFTSQTLNAMCHRLVRHYFLLTPEDLQMWDEDPENFATDETGESWKYSLRPCTESLFLSLFREFRSILAPIVLEMIQTNHSPVSPSDLNAILAKDAVYTAVGLAAFDLYDEVNFDHWFLTTLSQELQLQGGHYRVIRRRIAWLLGQWAGVKFSPELRPQLYGVMLSLLRPEEDIVVRLTVSQALKLAIDDFEFSTDQFLEYLEPAVALLFSLLKECQEYDTKMQVLYVLSFIIECIGQPCRPYISNLIQYLPIVWEEFAEHTMLRCAIVSTLVHIVKAMRDESQMLHSFLMPVLVLSTDLQQDSNVYLFEDGLTLWLTTVENATSMTDELMHLYQNMLSVLESSTEYLRGCLATTEAYILLSPECFLKVYGESVVKSFEYMLTDLEPEGVVLIMRLFETCIRATPHLACVLLKPVLPKVVMKLCAGEDSYSLFAVYISIIARALLTSRDNFSQIIRDAAHLMGENQDQVLAKLMQAWVKKMHTVYQLGTRKVLGLALTSLLTVQSGIIMEQFSGIMENIVEALNDITKTDESGSSVDILSASVSVPGSPASSDEVDYETEHDQRKKWLSCQDVVHTIVLRDYLQSQYNALKLQVGEIQTQQLLQTLDRNIASQLSEYITL